jgi:hypothetical protein
MLIYQTYINKSIFDFMDKTKCPKDKGELSLSTLVTHFFPSWKNFKKWSYFGPDCRQS